RLNGQLFAAFQSDRESLPRDILAVSSFASVDVSSITQLPFPFEVRLRDGTEWLFGAMSDADRTGWIDAIRRVMAAVIQGTASPPRTPDAPTPVEQPAGGSPPGRVAPATPDGDHPLPEVGDGRPTRPVQVRNFE